MEYKPTIGLEIHIELKTKSKMFCDCPNDLEERRPNVNICPICTAQPGTLPVVNIEAVKKVIKTGIALACQIPNQSKFDRKNYFYPDLPKGYQISQYDQPLCLGGQFEIPVLHKPEDKIKENSKDQNQETKKIRIRRIHLEEDTGRLVHPEGADYSLVDFNRAGVPLMELVTEPDITLAKEARKFAEELHLIMHYLDISDADMEKGQMRIEVNISLSGSKELGTKAEIKNLNSFRAVEKAIEYEIERQKKDLNAGKKIIQETRGWDDDRGITVSQREKEEAHDYRYFPEPDLPPLYFEKEFIQKIKSEIPELPLQRKKRFKREYNLLEKEAEIFVYNKNLGEYFEKAVSELGPNLSEEKLSGLIKLVSNYLITDLQGLLKGGSLKSREFLISPQHFAEFINLIYSGEISSKIAKTVLLEMFESGKNPSSIIKEKGLTQITDESEIEKIIREIVEQNPKVIEDYKKGKENALQYLIGRTMAVSKGKASPQIVNNILSRILGKLK